MAYAVQFTIGTGNKVSLNYQSQEVSIALTYQLERSDTDVLQTVREKAVEVALAHQTAWECLRDVKVAGKAEKRQPSNSSSPDHMPSPTALEEPVSVGPVEPPAVEEVATDGQQSALRALLLHIGVTEDDIKEQLKAQFSCSQIEELTRQQASQWLLQLQRQEREQAQQRRLQTAYSNGKPNSS